MVREEPRHRLLIVDDEESTRLLLARLLSTELRVDAQLSGTCEQALRFYEQHLGGRITMLMRRSELPDQPMKWPGWEQSIQYATMDLGETQLSASDVPPDRFKPMRSVYLMLTADSAAEAGRLWAVLSDGGQVLMPFQETFFVRHAGAFIAALTAAEATRLSQRKLALMQLLHPAHLGQKFQALHAVR